MKRLRTCIAILSVIVLLLSFCSCKNGKEQSSSYYEAGTQNTLLTNKIEVPIEGYKFVTFLNRGVIEISDEAGTYFGAMNRDGRVLIEPTRYSSLTMEGDFILAEGNIEEGLYTVLNLNGEIVYNTFKPITISDVGEGCVRVEEDGTSYIYNEKGEDLLGATSLDSTYDYTICTNYIAARSKTRKNAFVFARSTGDTLLSLYGSSTISFDLAYLGNKDFLVIREEIVDTESDCTYSLKESGATKYVRQTMQIHGLDGSAPRTVTTEAPIYFLKDRYSFGTTQQDRENFLLKEGYFCLATYRLDGKAANGSVDYCVVDASLRPLARMPENANPLVRPVKGISAVTGTSGALYLVDDSMKVLATFDDAVYQSASFSGSVVTATRIGEGSKRGCLDKEGNVVIPFEYSYISEFFGNYAIASKGGITYVVCTDGSSREIGEENFPYYWIGYYETVSGDKIGLASLDGGTLVPAVYDTLEGVGRYGGEVFVALKKDGKVTVFRLF